MTMTETAALSMLERFIGFETTSHLSNLPLIDFAADYLRGYGAEIRLTHDDEGRKANLFATLGGSGPGIVLSGHTDTVPVDGQNWTSNPFRLRQTDGKLFGRGVTDMKGFLASALAFVPEFIAKPLACPVHFALSYDEETGCLGVPRLLADLKQHGLVPKACIVGEPSMMEVVRSHKGKIGCHVTVRGRAAHTGVPHIGVNAIEAAAEAITCLKGIARRHRDNGPFAPDFTDPPYTTLQHGLISGGIAVNTVPALCTFDLDIRFLPGVDPMTILLEAQAFVEEHVLPEMQVVDPESGFTWEIVPGAEAFDTPANDPVIALAQRHSGTRAIHRVGYGTEAGHFQKAGIPTVICGPGHIDQAHKADEFMTLEQYQRSQAFMQSLVNELRVV